MAVGNSTCPCGDPLPVSKMKRKYCSDACRYRFRPPQKCHDSCSSCGTPMKRTHTSAPEMICHPCRRLRVEHGAAAYKRGCRCEVCRAAVAKRSREYAAKRRAEGRPIRQVRSRHAQVCLVCGSEFLVESGSKSQICSMKCVGIFKRDDPDTLKRDRSSRKPKRQRRGERRAAKAYRGTSGGARIWVQGPCLVCGAPYLSPGAMSRYCSRECRSKNRQRSFGLSWLERTTIFTEDNWTCQICSEPVDTNADPLSNWYPSLDHIIPRSHGGSDDVSNLRTAHRWCNSVRGDLSYYTDADLAVA